MKFNKHIPSELKETLTAQYKEYIMNTANVWADGQVPVEFLTISPADKGNEFRRST